ncbi:MAG: hypothetical protein KDD28_36190, partial [Phaeodactylibacter sp.]|nr:hypothetical protein [Phaeodactylibacter sp.]
ALRLSVIKNYSFWQKPAILLKNLPIKPGFKKWPIPELVFLSEAICKSTNSFLPLRSPKNCLL